MTDTDTDTDTDDDLVLPWWYSWWRVALITLLGAGALAMLIALGVRAQRPGADSVDVGFLQDMRLHHDQAVLMSAIFLEAPDATPVLRTIAGEIMLDQQFETGMMVENLDRLGAEGEASGDTVMAWMGTPLPLDQMPGMASEADLDALDEATGVAADRLFTELMIDHHRGGIGMALFAAQNAGDQRIRELAEALARNQESEINELTAALEAAADG
jgi:uncharacterized protein (DUF305 family)